MDERRAFVKVIANKVLFVREYSMAVTNFSKVDKFRSNKDRPELVYRQSGEWVELAW